MTDISGVVLYCGWVHEKNRHAVERGCEELKIKFLEAKTEKQVLEIIEKESRALIWSADRFLDVHTIPNPHVVVMGPHNFVFPQAELAGPRDVTRFPAERVRYCVPSQWVGDVYASLGGLAVESFVQPFGLDFRALVRLSF